MTRRIGLEHIAAALECVHVQVPRILGQLSMQAKTPANGRDSLEFLIRGLDITTFGTEPYGPCLNIPNGRRIRAS